MNKSEWDLVKSKRIRHIHLENHLDESHNVNVRIDKSNILKIVVRKKRGDLNVDDQS